MIFIATQRHAIAVVLQCCLMTFMIHQCPATTVQNDATEMAEWEALDGKQVLERVSKTLNGTVDESFKMILAAGEGFVVELEENPWGIGKFAGYLGNDGQFWIPYWDSDGYCGACNSFYKLDSINSGVFGIAGTPVLGYLNWKPVEQGFEIELSFSSDITQNQELLKRISGDECVGRMPFDQSEKIEPTLISENDRIAAWTKLWSEVKYNFVFFDQVPELDWESAFLEDLPKIRAAKTNAEYFRILQRRVAMLNDGHTEVYGEGILPSGAWLPIASAINSKDEIVITSVIPVDDIPNDKRRNELVSSNLKTGEVITHIDGRPIRDFLHSEIYPYISAGTKQWRNSVAEKSWDRGKYHSEVVLRMRSVDGGNREVKIVRSHYQTNQTPKPKFRPLENECVYIRLDSFASDLTAEFFESHLDEIRNSKGLVIDLRFNGGGDSAIGTRIISHLVDAPIRESAWRSRKYIPAFRAWSEKEAWHVGEPEWIQPVENRFLGPVVLLIGPRTFSAAEDFAVALHQARRVTLVGAKTGGSTGQPLRVELPGGGSARICCKRDAYPDGREFVGVGVIPDVLIPLTSSDNEAIKAAINALTYDLK